MKWLGHQLARCWHWLWPASVSLVEFSGPSGPGEEPLKVLCGVSGWNRHYLRQLMFPGAVTETKLGRFWLRKLLRSSASGNSAAALMLLPVTLTQAPALTTKGWLFIPSWLRGEIPLPLPAALLKRQELKGDLRKIRKHGFGYEIAHGRAAFREFFYQMNQPYVRSVFGAATFTDWLAEHRRWLVNYDLIFIHRPSEPHRRLAGCLLIYEATGPRLWTLGVREGCFEEVKNGVIAALYHFSFQHVQAQGFNRLRTGNSRAWLDDGVLRFKKKMGNRIIGIYPHGWALKILRLDPATRRFLLANPFTLQDAGGLHAAIFTETPLTLAQVLAWRKRYFFEGFASLIIYSFGVEETFSTAQLPPELAATVQLRAAAELLRS